MPELPRAILFDLDDTIIHDSSNIEEGWLAAVESNAGALRGLTPTEVIAVVHEVRRWYWSDSERHRVGRVDLRGATTWIVGEAFSQLGLNDPALAQRVAHDYRDLREGARTLFPGAIETLAHVRRLGIARALLTNGDSAGQRAKIAQFDLAPYFDYICIEEEFGCGKPDERVYSGALDAIGSTPDGTWMIGDNLEWDVAAPMRLGIAGIWHDRFKTGLPAGSPIRPTRIVHGINELLPE